MGVRGSTAGPGHRTSAASCCLVSPLELFTTRLAKPQVETSQEIQSVEATVGQVVTCFPRPSLL